MTNATVQGRVEPTTQRMRWGRILIGAVLIETALVAAAVPLFALLANPFVAGAEGASGDFTPFFVSVAVACFVIGGLFGAWVARPLSSQLRSTVR